MKNYFNMSIYDWAFVLMTSIIGTFAVLKSCGTKEKVITVTQPGEPVEPAACPDGSASGTIRTKQCSEGQAGKILEACNNGEWVIADNSCKDTGGNTCIAGQKITWENKIKGLVTSYCIQCHAQQKYNEFQVAKTNFDIFLDRITRDNLDPRRMPKLPNAALSPENVKAFQQWKADGLLEKDECEPEDQTGGDFQYNDLDYIETKILEDLNRLDSREREDSQYLVLSHKYNQRLPKQEMKAFVDGINKSLNSLSLKDTLGEGVAIDARETIWRFDLGDFDLDAQTRFGKKLNEQGQEVSKTFWDLVLEKEPFKFESFTTKGLLIKGLSGDKIAWLHADNFVFTAAKDDALYYAAVNVPATLQQFLIDTGSDFQQRFDDFEAILAGGFGSPISLNKNRLLSRVETDRGTIGKEGGYLWFTYDPIDLGGVAERNLFQFPFPAEVRSDLVFQHAAGEAIWQLPNGMQGYALFNAAGDRQAEAPTNVVIDVDSPFSPVIEVMNSCPRCHAQGIIPYRDEVRASVLANASEFSNDNLQKIKAFYPVANDLAKIFAKDREALKKVMLDAKLDPQGIDPINFLTDNIRKDWTLAEFCAFVFVPLQECSDLINSSAALKGEIGQLITGGTVSFQQAVQSFPKVIADFRLGQEDINR